MNLLLTSRRSILIYVELPDNVTVEKGSLAYVDAVCMSHSWPTCQEGVNDTIYVQDRE